MRSLLTSRNAFRVAVVAVFVALAWFIERPSPESRRKPTQPQTGGISTDEQLAARRLAIDECRKRRERLDADVSWARGWFARIDRVEERLGAWVALRDSLPEKQVPPAVREQLNRILAVDPVNDATSLRAHRGRLRGETTNLFAAYERCNCEDPTNREVQAACGQSLARREIVASDLQLVAMQEKGYDRAIELTQKVLAGEPLPALPAPPATVPDPEPAPVARARVPPSIPQDPAGHIVPPLSWVTWDDTFFQVVRRATEVDCRELVAGVDSPPPWPLSPDYVRSGAFMRDLFQGRAPVPVTGVRTPSDTLYILCKPGATPFQGMLFSVQFRRATRFPAGDEGRDEVPGLSGAKFPVIPNSISLVGRDRCSAELRTALLDTYARHLPPNVDRNAKHIELTDQLGRKLNIWDTSCCAIGMFALDSRAAYGAACHEPEKTDPCPKIRRGMMW